MYSTYSSSMISIGILQGYLSSIYYRVIKLKGSWHEIYQQSIHSNKRYIYNISLATDVSPLLGVLLNELRKHTTYSTRLNANETVISPLVITLLVWL